MNEAELKTKYDDKDIFYLEKLVDDNKKLSRESQKEMIETLIYIKVTGRWKENKRYASATFERYLEDRFYIRRGSFIEMQRAYTKFTKQTIEFGVGLIAKIERKCGPIKMKSVFNELEKAGETKLLTPKQIDRIIEKHKDPERERKAREQKHWKTMYEKETVAHEKTKEALRGAMERIKELEEQNEKLKKTAKLVPAIRKVMQEHEGRIAVG